MSKFSYIVAVTLLCLGACQGAQAKKSAPVAATPAPGFCGRSSQGVCGSDADCITAGCSGQICQSKKEEGGVSSCEYRDCYDAKKFQLNCGCFQNTCQWH